MNLDSALSLLAQAPDGPVDLADVSLGIAREEYPHLDVEGYRGELVNWGRDLGSQLSGSLSRRVERLNRYLFAELGFRGNREDYYDPRNSYLNDVIDQRVGLPILLTLVTMSVGAEAGLMIDGIGLPGHFIARAVQGEESVLFDPFNEGQILDLEECERLIQEATGQQMALSPEAFMPLPPGAFVLRMLTNLKGAYIRLEDYGRTARILARLRQLAPHDPQHVRDEGFALLHAGRPGRALESLRAYAERAPHARDVPEVEALMQKALVELSRWN